MKKRGLGRGLNDLGINELLSELQQPVGQAQQSEFKHLSIELIEAGQYQPRKDMDLDALQELADSIRTQGILQPIVVRPKASGRYEIIAGERRFRAAKIVELSEVPVIVKDVNDEAAIAMALIENIQREDLNAMEEAVAIKRLIDEFQLTHEEAAKALGKSRTMVSNLLRLFNLNPDVRTMLERGDIDMGHARALLALDDFKQTQAAKQIISKELSVREAEKLIHKLQQPEKEKTQAKPNPDLVCLQNQLSDKLAAKVVVQHQASGKGKLIIHYHNLDELDGILAKIKD